MRWSVLWGFFLKELQQTLRDRRIAFVVFAAPLIQIVVYGYVISTEVRQLRIGVPERPLTAEQRALLRHLTASGSFVLAARGDPLDLMQRNRVQVFLEFSRNFPRDGRMLALLDGTEALRSQTALRRLMEFAAWYNDLSPPIQTRVLYNPRLKSRIYMLPGVLAMILIILVIVTTSVAVVRERENGTLEQILVSPITSWEFILGKVFPYLTLAFLEATAVLLVAHFWFGMAVHRLPFVALSSAIFLLAIVSLALIASVLSDTQAQTMMTGILLVLPLIMLSGLFFPIASMPPGFQRLAQVNPVTHYLIIVRSAFIKQAGPADLWPSFLLLLALSTALTLTAITLFRRKYLS